MLKYSNLKMFSDFIFACILLVVLSPLMMVFALLIKWEDPHGTIFFKQKRLGKDHKTFTLYKLRSMRMKNEKNSQLVTDEERMLNVGRIMRLTSIDELPQLINILKGEMSFIGPRPLFVEYLPYYTDREKQRHNVKPGISGWAQVNGRENVTWEQKFKLDLEYVDQYNLLFDLKITVLTIKKVINRSDIVEDTQNLSDYRLKQLDN